MDDPGLIALPSVRTELLRTGGLSWWVPPRAGIALLVMGPSMVQPALDTEFMRYAPTGLLNSVLMAMLEALSPHVWKLLAAAVGKLDTHCRMASLVWTSPSITW